MSFPFAPFVALLAFLFLCFLHQQAAGPLARGVDSYPCLQAERNRAPSPGCVYSTKETVRGTDG